MTIRMILMMALLSAPFPQPGLASDIPRAAERHRAELIRVSRAVWGLEAPVAVFAAQVHTESWWRNGTVSSAGAVERRRSRTRARSSSKRNGLAM